MKFIRIGALGQERPVVLVDQASYDISEITADITGQFLESDGIGRVREALAAGRLPVTEIGGERIGSPIVRPSAVICIGMNYAAHAAESGSLAPTIPIMFLKTPNTVVGPNDDVAIPRASTKTDWEVELGVVISRRASYLDSPADSIDHIAGFVVANDLSEREFQLELSGGQWSKGKSAPGFNPTGLWLVTPDDVDYIIWHLSQFLTLEPGDLVLTGTPEGVALSGRFPYLRAGDVCELEIDGLGRQRQLFV